jgi:hypothetical protein
MAVFAKPKTLFVSATKPTAVFEPPSTHPLYEKADKLSSEVIGAAIEVHREKGPGLIESIYERCMLRELELRSIPATTQKWVRVEFAWNVRVLSSMSRCVLTFL